MFSKLVPIVVVALVLPASAMAQFKGGSATLFYDQTNYDGGDVSATGVEIKGGIGFGESAGVDLVFSTQSGSYDETGDSGDWDAHVLGGRVYYAPSPESKVGVYFESVSAGWAGTLIDANLMGVDGSFAVGENATVSAFYGVASGGDVPDSTDVVNFGIRGDMAFGNGLSLGLFYKHDGWDFGGSELKVNEYGIRGEMNLKQLTGANLVAHVELSNVDYDNGGSTSNDTRIVVGATIVFGDVDGVPNGFMGHRTSGHGIAVID